MNASISWFNSTVDSCSRRMDCCNWGVRVRCWESLSCRLCFMNGLRFLACAASQVLGSSKFEVLTEVNLSYALIINDFIGLPVGQHGAFVDDVGSIADAQGL